MGSAIQELSLGFEPVFNVSARPLSTRQIDLEGAHGNLVVTRPPRCLGPGFVEVLCDARGLALVRTRHQSPPLARVETRFPSHPSLETRLRTVISFALCIAFN